MKQKINPRITFRIYPDSKSRIYCHVSIWRSLEEMHEANENGTDYDGMCTEVDITDYKRNERPRKKPRFAEMNLALNRITWRIITHEVFHATLYWMRRKKISSQLAEDNMKVEESCAYAYTQLLDNLVEQLGHNHLQVSQ